MSGWPRAEKHCIFTAVFSVIEGRVAVRRRFVGARRRCSPPRACYGRPVSLSAGGGGRAASVKEKGGVCECTLSLEPTMYRSGDENSGTRYCSERGLIWMNWHPDGRLDALHGGFLTTTYPAYLLHPSSSRFTCERYLGRPRSEPVYRPLASKSSRTMGEIASWPLCRRTRGRR